MANQSRFPVFVLCVAAGLFCRTVVCAEEKADPKIETMNPAKAKDWLARWEKSILGDSRNRYCDKELGEEIGWMVTPFLEGYYYGYKATNDPKWVDMLVDWADSLIKRGVKEPDGFIGWPKGGATGTELTKELYTDSQLGEAMALKPIVLMAAEILKTPALKEKHGKRAEEYIRLAEQIFEKWESRGAWREVKDGGVWVVPPFGIDKATGKWTDGYERRTTDCFTLPDNKQNLIAGWILALYDVTQKPIYKEHAEKWFRVMRSRMKLSPDGKYFVWNYWDAGGPWDTKADGSLKHWVGVHPNGGYYGVDLDAIVAAYEHGLVFTKEDIERLIATNRDFMWNQQISPAKFKRIDGGEPDKRWEKSPGVLWVALIPYDAALRKIFEANHDPASWGGTTETPWYLAKFGAK